MSRKQADLKLYDILSVGGKKYLLAPLSAVKMEILYHEPFQDLLKVIHEVHIVSGVAGRNGMIKELNRKYKNVTQKSSVT